MFSSDKWFGAEASFYNGVATQSLRFNDNDTASLSWSPSSAGNRKKWTFSTWLKRSNITNASSGDQYIFSQATGSNNNDSFIALIFRGDDLDVTCHSLEVLRSNAKFRDVGAWYHILWVLDTENSTASHRMRLYVNGDEITSFSTDNRSNSQLDGTNMPILNNATHYIGRYGGDTSRNFDGYLAYTELVEGEALTPSSFTEEKNGVLIPNAYSGDHGTYGFRLEYKQTGDGSSSPSTSTIGADTKSNSTKQHWNDNNLDAYDSNMPDSPENNWCTLNPLELDENNSGAATLEGNLKWTNVNANIGSTFGFGNQGGKYYWEYLYLSSTDGNQYQGVTLQKDGISLTNAFSTGIALYFEDGTTRVDGVSGTGFAGKINADNIIQFKLDLDNGTLEFGKNNTYISALTLPTSTGGWRAGGIQAAGSGGTRVFVANYGQDSSFAGNKTSGSAEASDDNGFGDFYYAPPSGFLAVCSANLPEPTISPNADTQSSDHFNTVLFDGTGSSPLAVTGIGHQPDWLWLKRRDNATNGHHILYDSIRGGTNALRASTNTAEAQFGDMVITFQSDGFSFTGTDGLNASSSYNNVAWSWLANGGTTVTNDASATGIGSIDSVYQANTTSGFSIVTYTGSSSGNNGTASTVAHGLGAVPKWIWFLPRDTYDGCVYHAGVASDPATDKLLLKTSSTTDSATASSDDAGFFNDTEPTSTVFSIGTRKHSNSNGGMVAYCFAEVEGFSKFGSFTGNGSTDGTFVYTGFRPQFVIAKCSSHSSAWHIVDADIDTNPVGYLNANTIDAYQDYNHYDLLSNGFKIRDNGTESNRSGGTFIYMAFAEAPFKYANAR